MDRLQFLNPIQKHKNVIGIFRGINATETATDAEWAKMENLSSNEYPAASARNPRGDVIKTITKPNGLYFKNGLLYVDGTKLYYKDELISESMEDSEKLLCGMGAYVVIYPDKKVFNTSTKEIEDIEHTFTQSASATLAPTYDASVYTRITCTGIGAGLSQGDGVTISGIAVKGTSGEDVLNGSKVIQSAGDDYIVIIGQISAQTTQGSGITVKRTAPDLDYMCESDNRIYGCNSENHEIYACKLGDPKNWNCFEGTSTDSYAATIGSDGDFTGAISYMGYVLFFKEESIIKLYGTKPSNIQINTYPYRGVAKGAAGSLCVVNETLYYASTDSVMRYDGAVPESISDQLGRLSVSRGMADHHAGKYYLNIIDAGTERLIVYDTRYQMWHEEQDNHFEFAAHGDNNLYYINASEGLRTIEDIEGSERVEWFAESGIQVEGDMNRKRIAKLQLMVQTGPDTLFEVYISYDGSQVWKRVYTKRDPRRISDQISITPEKCNYFRYKIKGIGQFKLLGVAKYTQIAGPR